MTRRSKLHALLPAALIAALVACEAQKSSNPLSPSVAGPIPGVEITAPKLLEPSQGFRLKENQQPIKLMIENSSSSGVRPVSYIFEVASDLDFNTKVFARSGVTPGENGRTSVQIDALELGRTYFWRVKADDGANASTYATADFSLLPRPVLTRPSAASPVDGAVQTTRTPLLRLNNSTHNEAVGDVSYFFVVARDQAFTQIVATGVVPEGSGVTQWTVDRELDYGFTHYWHARATDGEVTTDWSPTATFKAPAAPGGGGGGGPTNPGGPCTGTTGLRIVECERAKYGFMSTGQMLDFMRAVARSLNANGIDGAPFGILRKSGGHNCGGYSCDVICSGSGNGQRQWDVLGDIDGSQTPSWGGPNTVPNIRVDTCVVP